VSTQTESKTLAHQILIERIRETQQIREGIKVSSDIPLSVFCEKYLNYVKARRKPHTHRSYLTILNSVEVFAQKKGIERLRAIDRAFVEDYLTYLREVKQLRGKTCNNKRIVLSSMFNWAVDRKYIGQNPAKGIKKFGTGDSKPIKVLNDDEWVRFLGVSKSKFQHYYPIFYTFLNTGMRYNELLSLEWDDIAFDKKILWIKVSKTSDKPEPVYMHDNLIKVLQTVPKVAKKVFTDEAGQPFSYRSRKIIRRFKKILAIAGIEGMCRLHELRHTFCSQLMDKNVHVRLVMEHMRHKNLETTQHYAQFFESSAHNSVEVLAALDK